MAILTIGNNQPNKLSLYRNQVLKVNKMIDTLRKSPSGLSIKQVAESTGLSNAMCSKHLAILHAKGTIGLNVVGNCKIYFARRGNRKLRTKE